MTFLDRVKAKIEFLRQRRGAYKTVFEGASGKVVLQDLATFCRANDSCFAADARLHAVLEGRREVWLRIQQHLGMTPEQLLAYYDRQSPVRVQTSEAEQ